LPLDFAKKKKQYNKLLHFSHVSFSVATSVLNDELFGTSAGSSWTLELPAGQGSLSLYIPFCH
jgi:hypothetical protein